MTVGVGTSSMSVMEIHTWHARSEASFLLDLEAVRSPAQSFPGDASNHEERCGECEAEWESEG